MKIPYFGLILVCVQTMKNILVFSLVFVATVAFSQQTDSVNFTRAHVNATVEPGEKSIFCLVTYYFDVLKPVDSIFLDAKNMTFMDVVLNGESVDFIATLDHLIVKSDFEPSGGNELSVEYRVSPKKAMYFVEKNDYVQVWTQGQGKYTSNWLPSLDDPNEKIEFDFTILGPRGFEVVTNGKLIETNKGRFDFDMEEPMSSYLVALVVGKYGKKTIYSKHGTPLELYYYPEDSSKVEPTYRYTKKMFDFLEQELGYAYPWQNYKQVPVHDFLYAGMENTSTTIFADTYVVDSIGFNDKNYVNVNAHELAHQWFGNLVTATSGEHHWLQEGFATYYALLAERAIFGNNYYYWRLYEYAQELKDQDRMGNGTSLLNPKASSLTFYKRGAWTLHALREQVGDSAYRAAIKNYLNAFAFKNAETSDFISKVQESSGQDLTSFVDTWIKSDVFPYKQAHELFMQSKFIQEYEMVDCEAVNSKCSYYLNSYVSDEAKIKIIRQRPDLITSETFENSIPVRRAIAEVLTTVPKKLKADYETLLDDDSYLTKEVALYNLWVNYPEDRFRYLDKLANVEGLTYNVRLLWLVLALNTAGYKETDREKFYHQLVDFTGTQYNFEVRIHAFQYLISLGACNEGCKANLEAATGHHNWRLAKFAKEQLEKIN